MNASNQQIKKRVVELLQDVLQCDGETLEVDGESYINTLGLNSFDLVDLICALEKEFNVSIPDELISEFETINDFVSYISKSQIKSMKQKECVAR